MAELFTTSDIITYVLAYIGQAKQALRAECGLALLEYRMIAYLCDHVDGISPSALAGVLSVSPASITLAADNLAGRKLIVRGGEGLRPRHISISKEGIDAGRDADIVLAQAHGEYFAPLPPHLKATVDIGSIVTNRESSDAMRMRDGHFFTAFETLHAFLIVERLLTRSTHKSGISLTQFRILFEAERQGGSASPGNLAEALLLAPPTISYALAGLCDRKLVVLRQSDADRRSCLASATAEGTRVFAAALTGVEAVFTTDIRSSTRRERDAYKDAAMIMVSSLRKQAGPARA